MWVVGGHGVRDCGDGVGAALGTVGMGWGAVLGTVGAG